MKYMLTPIIVLLLASNRWISAWLNNALLVEVQPLTPRKSHYGKVCCRQIPSQPKVPRSRFMDNVTSECCSEHYVRFDSGTTCCSRQQSVERSFVLSVIRRATPSPSLASKGQPR